MDLLSRLEHGSALVAADANKLILGKPVREEHLAAAAQKAVDRILSERPEINLKGLTQAQILEFLKRVAPAND